MSDSAYLRWTDDGFLIWAASVMNDDGLPFMYRFKRTADGYAWRGDDELILGPMPAAFRDQDAAKSWAARTELKWQQSGDPPVDEELAS